MPDNFVANPGAGGATFASDDIGGVQYPRTKIVIGADGVNGGDVSAANPIPSKITDGTNAATMLSDGAGVNGLGVSIVATNFAAGAGNTTTAQLGAGATFTGTVETIFAQQAISLLLTSDQNGTLILNQYIDAAGLRKAATQTFPVTAGAGFSRSFVANGNYFNLSFQNNGASATTTLNINTFYGTLPASTNRGNLPMSIEEIGGAAIAIGQSTMAASFPVTLASNQSTLPVSLAVNTPVIAAGTNLIGKVGIDQTTVGTTNAVSLAQVGATTVASGNGVVGAGVQRVAIASDNTAFAVNSTLSAETTKVIGTVNIAAAQTLATVTTVSAVTAISNALPAGTNLLGKVGIDQTTVGTTNAVSLAQIGATTIASGNGVVSAGVARVAIASDNTAFNVINTPVTPTSNTLNSAATTNATSVKGSAGTVWSIAVSNSGAAAAFLKIYNKATAPTVGTDVPVLTIPIGASAVVTIPTGANGIRLATGIAFAITNLVADSDTTAVAASQVKTIITYT